ncbi:endonuclease III [Candidatus Endomicrobiellum devescovinae]|jgi:endonuclease-3|uniref:endonuclease III n=1 Tax=Candidatus Endomicrobiellum devescovinae TaxID=3242322 RepID=UPI0028233679|nr:endonuclease III [Endomicrobium sp.]MDR1434240.1 endonuclease III [Endomicrobium sp.]
MEKDKKKYVLKIIKNLKETFGYIKCPLKFSNPFEILVAVILSAQCTDERVNKITESLFKKYKRLQDYANADISEFENRIKSAGFFRNKAKNIIKSAQMVLRLYDGQVPQTMEELLKLPGVARKTANVVLGHAFCKAEGIAVDTHVIRIANLLKLTKYENPVKIEKDLMAIVPKQYWINFSLLIQTLGRKVCKARNPNHAACPLNKICPSVKKSVPTE